MCDEKHEQWINVKFLVKLKKKTATDCYTLLKDVVVRILYLLCMFLNGINDFLKSERALKMTTNQLTGLCFNSINTMKVCTEIVV